MEVTTKVKTEKSLLGGLHLKPFNSESGVQLLMFGHLVSVLLLKYIMFTITRSDTMGRQVEEIDSNQFLY
jgi:hypothetical protein